MSVYEATPEAIPYGHIGVIPERAPAQSIPSRAAQAIANLPLVAAHNKWLRRATYSLAIGSSALALAPAVYKPAGLAESWVASDATALIEDAVGDTPTIDMRTASPKQAYDYLTSYFGMSDGLFKKGRLDFAASTWWNITAANAMQDMSLLPGKHASEYTGSVKNLMHSLNLYWHSGQEGQSSGYYPDVVAIHNESFGEYDDDNAWAGLALLRQGDPASVTRSEGIFNLLMSQWDVKGGGISWKVQLPGEVNRDRSAVSNAPAAELAFGLYFKTGKKQRLEEGNKVLDWTLMALYDPKTGLYNDHLPTPGDKDTYANHKWTYVEGTIIGAMTLANQSSSENAKKYPLSKTLELANRSLEYFKYCDSIGIPAFQAVYFRNLLYLVHALQKNHDPRAEQLLPKVRLAMANSIAHLPKQPTNLLDAAGGAAIIALNEMPESDYGQLLPSPPRQLAPQNSTTKYAVAFVQHG
jgi:hypothetical protein